ncbi:MAG TPA: peptidylprolyl isomerase [Woeseiaceae bacterium]|nr:peptidylprolyl isomerase [Woeseiaceae bacterium]
MKVRILAFALLMILSCLSPLRADQPLTVAEVLESSKAEDWRPLEQDRLLYLELPVGQVVFELAPQFAPRHIENLRKLVRQKYFDGLAIIRSQDNYVVQWGDPAGGGEGARPFGDAATSLQPEFYRKAEGLDFVPLDSNDAYSAEVGFAGGFPVGRDGQRAWLAHCYGMLGVGRANEPESGSAAELYVVTGHAPRHLDRNVTLIGRTVAGIERLSALPRGTGALGFYESEDQYMPIASMRFGTELDDSARVELEALRTDTQTFEKFVEARRTRREEWFVDPAGHVELCNVPLPVRPVNK